MERISPTNISQILASFLPNANAFKVTPLSQGLINDTFKVGFKNKTYVLQRINTHVFSNPENIMENIIKLQNLTFQQRYTAPTFIKNASGNYLSPDPKGGLWRLQRYILNSRAYNWAPNAAVAYEAGRLLVQFHRALKNTKTNEFYVILPHFHHITVRLNAFNLAFKKADTAQLATAQKALEIIAQLKGFVQQAPKNLPLRVCHNDPKLNNMLMDINTGKGLCLIDLDTLMPGYAFYDFGDAFRTVISNAKETSQHPPNTFKKDHAIAFIKGMATHKEVFSPLEWDSFALGAVYMPYIHGLRALTDYFNGNLYYKVSYPNENLDRALSLLSVAAMAYQNLDIIKKALLTPAT